MSIPISTERRMLGEAEFETVAPTHYPGICELSPKELGELAGRLRQHRGKARALARGQRREMRGKAEPRGRRAAGDDRGQAAKSRIFAQALKRVNRERSRHRADEAKAAQSESLRRALELKRSNRVRHHPSAGRTAGQGMHARPNPTAAGDSHPAEIGTVSRIVKEERIRNDGTPA